MVGVNEVDQQASKAAYATPRNGHGRKGPAKKVENNPLCEIRSAQMVICKHSNCTPTRPCPSLWPHRHWCRRHQSLASWPACCHGVPLRTSPPQLSMNWLADTIVLINGLQFALTASSHALPVLSTRAWRSIWWVLEAIWLAPHATPL